MIVEYRLSGSIMVHGGMFESTGFWLRLEAQQEEKWVDADLPVEGWKLFNHGSFAFYHTNLDYVALVHQALILACHTECDWSHKEIGRIKSFRVRS